ncbi:MAG TPA: site-specific integrase [Thermoanaerobaculia bacterium]|nr:site-specific integrase [Thermoanaerobaculia bacterium]
MPRKSRDTDLSTPTARRRLKPKANRAPYYRSIAKGQFVGYRKPKSGPGTWTGRVYRGDGEYDETALGTADDEASPDGSIVLNYSQAVQAALSWCVSGAAKLMLPPPAARYTVGAAMSAYLDWYKAHRKSAGYESTRVMVTGSILPSWRDKPVEELTTTAVRKWHQDIAAAPGRFRPGRDSQRTRELNTDDPEQLRKRKATANRILTVFKAALNFGVGDERIPAELAPRWRSVKPFRGVDMPKLRFFEAQEIARLMNQCDRDFRQMVTGALLTGARWGELTNMDIRDFIALSRSVRVSGKTDTRLIYLNEEGIAFFSALTAGRPADAPMFVRADGERWARSHQTRRMAEAVKAAEIPSPNSYHILRHTYASHYLMNGGTVEGLSKQLGHSDTRMTIRSYAHLASSWRKTEAAAYAPSFAAAPPTNVNTLRLVRES